MNSSAWSFRKLVTCNRSTQCVIVLKLFFCFRFYSTPGRCVKKCVAFPCEMTNAGPSGDHRMSSTTTTRSPSTSGFSTPCKAGRRATSRCDACIGPTAALRACAAPHTPGVGIGTVPYQYGVRLRYGAAVPVPYCHLAAQVQYGYGTARDRTQPYRTAVYGPYTAGTVVIPNLER